MNTQAFPFCYESSCALDQLVQAEFHVCKLWIYESVLASREPGCQKVCESLEGGPSTSQVASLELCESIMLLGGCIIFTQYYSTTCPLDLQLSGLAKALLNTNLMLQFKVKEKIEEYNAKGNPVAAVLIEPIQGEGGDNHASPEYFRNLQQLCKEVLSYIHNILYRII